MYSVFCVTCLFTSSCENFVSKKIDPACHKASMFNFISVPDFLEGREQLFRVQNVEAVSAKI